jgi:hypothetical protein
MPSMRSAGLRKLPIKGYLPRKMTLDLTEHETLAFRALYNLRSYDIDLDNEGEEAYPVLRERARAEEIPHRG